MDRFYTPTSIANLLAGAVESLPGSVADFAAGEGALLDAAFSRWPNARLFASDINSTAVAGLATRYPCIEVQCADFLSAFPFSGTLFDLVLLNPPFSCRGNERLAGRVGNMDVQCSRAMAFVCRALDYLSERGELLCILPASCLSSEKDAAARAAISAAYGVDVIDARVNAPFDKCSVLVSLIRIGRQVSSNRQWRLRDAQQAERRAHIRGNIILGRGSTPVHKTRLEAVTTGSIFVHTTDLRGGHLSVSRVWSARGADLLGESAILFPRVGRPSKSKVVIAHNETLVLSDCLFFVKAKNEAALETLHRLIISEWDALADMYGGSCAPYISLSQARKFLESLGYSVEIDNLKRSSKKQTVPVEVRESGSGARPEMNDQLVMCDVHPVVELYDAVG